MGLRRGGRCRASAAPHTSDPNGVQTKAASVEAFERGPQHWCVSLRLLCNLLAISDRLLKSCLILVRFVGVPISPTLAPRSPLTPMTFHSFLFYARTYVRTYVRTYLYYVRTYVRTYVPFFLLSSVSKRASVECHSARIADGLPREALALHRPVQMSFR